MTTLNIPTDSFQKPKVTYQLPRADTQLGVIVRIVDLGMQKNAFFEQEKAEIEKGSRSYPAKEFKPMLEITFELPDDLLADGEQAGKPLFISKEFTNTPGNITKKSGLRSLVDAALRKEVTDAELKALDLSVILGKGVTLEIEHKVSKNKKTYAKIRNIIKTDSRTVVPSLVNEALLITSSSSEADLNKLSTFTKEKLAKGKLGTQLADSPF